MTNFGYIGYGMYGEISSDPNTFKPTDLDKYAKILNFPNTIAFMKGVGAECVQGNVYACSMMWVINTYINEFAKRGMGLDQGFKDYADAYYHAVAATPGLNTGSGGKPPAAKCGPENNWCLPPAGGGGGGPPPPNSHAVGSGDTTTGLMMLMFAGLGYLAYRKYQRSNP